MKNTTKEEIKEEIARYFKEYASTPPDGGLIETNLTEDGHSVSAHRPLCWENFGTWVSDLHDIVDWAYLKEEKSEE